ncbi:MAG: glycosyltransferase family 4 protein [Gelidibacter sp.]
MKQKIAFLIYDISALGGAERVVTALANYFTDYYEVTIISILKAEPFYPLHKKVKIIYCRENEVVKSNPFLFIKNNFSLYQQIKRKLEGEKINLLICFMTASNVFGSLAAKSLGIPCIISERTNPITDNTNFAWRKLKSFAYPKADVVVVQSPLIKEFYETMTRTEKIIILPNPLSNELTDSKVGSLKKENIVLNVGRLIRSKNQDLLIRAFANINHKDWKLVFLGDGPLLSEFQGLAADLQISDKVIFVGKTDDVASYYNTSKIFAFTSKYEGFPNALIEAMYFELACISTDCPSGPAEMIHHNENGYLIDIGDQKNLEIHLNTLMNNDALCKSIGKKGFDTASHYELAKVATKWKSIIENLLKA